jgi:mono/diheme cytochrome c family protein
LPNNREATLVAPAVQPRLATRSRERRPGPPKHREDGGPAMSWRTYLLRCSGILLVAITAAACRQDMHDQPKYRGLRGSSFFADGLAARPVIAGTVPRGGLNDDPLLYTGMENGVTATVFPFPVDEQVMARGQERFNIYCAPCHGRTGLGDGMIVQRGYRRPPPFDDARLRDAPVGHFFDVITHGFGAMPDYASQIRPADRWAITAYLRALQLSAHATLTDVPPAERPALESGAR